MNDSTRNADNRSALAARDVAVLWHPCTQMKDHESLPPIPVRRAEGAWLEGYDGRRYLDAISSWWVNLFGHCHPRIVEAQRRQVGELDHVLLAGFTHQPAVTLCERLLSLVPPGLSRCFFSDNGSSAVEVALKMSFHYWQNVGRAKKQRFMCLENGYHGETLGALAVSGVPLYREVYGPLLQDVIQAPSPDCYRRPPGATWEEHSLARLRDLEALLEDHAEETCAVIVEPLVQCAGSMRMYHPVYLEQLRAACDRYQVHLIADEIAVGFGRTGTLFACAQAGISPDILCLSKGLSGGTLPLALTLCNETLYQAFYDDYQTRKAFLHSHSYCGNAIACSAALAVLDLFEEEPVLERVNHLGAVLEREAAVLADHPHVAEVRRHGLILAAEMVRDKTSRTAFPWQERRGHRVHQYALQQGVLLRPLGDVVYFMPPYVVTEDELRLMVQTALQGIEHAVRD